MADEQNNNLINSLIGGMNKAFSDIAKAIETLANSSSSSNGSGGTSGNSRSTKREQEQAKYIEERINKIKDTREKTINKLSDPLEKKGRDKLQKWYDEQINKLRGLTEKKDKDGIQKWYDELKKGEKREKNIQKSQRDFREHLGLGALGTVIATATIALKDKFKALTNVLVSSGDSIASSAAMMGEAFDNIAKKSADIAEEATKQEAFDVNFFDDPLAWIASKWAEVKGDVAASKITQSNAKLRRLGISDPTRLALTSALMSQYTNVGYSGDSVASLVGGMEATLLRFAKLNNISNAAAFNIGTSGKYEQLGAAGENSLAFKGYLYNQGLLKDYMNDAQIAGKYAEYLTDISFKKSVTEIALYNAELARTGMIANQVGKNLYEFDEVINQNAKDMSMPEYGYDAQLKSLVNIDKQTKDLTKDYDEQSQSLIDVEEQTKELRKDYEDIWSLFKTFMGGKAEMLLYLQQKGYSLDEAERIVDEIFSQETREAQFELWLKYSSDNEYTLSQAKEVIDDIAGHSGESFDTLIDLDPSSDETIDKLKDVYNMWTALDKPVNLKLNWNDEIRTAYYYIKPLIDAGIIDYNNTGELTSGAEDTFSSGNDILVKPVKAVYNPDFIPHKADGGVVTSDLISEVGEGGRAEAIIPLETQGGIDYLASALQEAGASGSTIVNVNLSGQLLEMNDYSVRRLGEKLASIIDNETNRRGALNYGNQN